MRYYSIWFVKDLKMTFTKVKFDLALTMKVKADHHQKLISWAPINILYTQQVWSWSDNIYSKNKGFVDFDVWPSGDLDLRPWPSIFFCLIAIDLMSLHVKFGSDCYKTVLSRTSWNWKNEKCEVMTKKKKTESQTDQHISQNLRFWRDNESHTDKHNLAKLLLQD